jgi:TolB-like protein
VWEADLLYRFDAFELDDVRYELRQDGAARHTEPLVFDLLLYFVRNPGRVVTKDDIVTHVWRGRAVSDATIASALKAARRALGDSGDAQGHIRTVRGRGFEFACPVSTDQQAASALDSAGTSGTAPVPVLAVLPFTNLSIEADDYFADGLTEDIITNLVRFRDARVIAGASTFRFKGPAIDLAEVRATLRADFVVQGSVRRAGGRVRVSVRLIDTASGMEVWSDRYDREMGDIFAVQDEVTRTVAAALGVRIQDAGLRRALTKKPTELDAYDCLLRARRYTRTLTPEMHLEARDLLERAVELDPLSSDAHALLSNIYLAEYRFEMNPRPNPIGRAMVHALAATQLDPGNAYARCWLAIVHFFRGEIDKFEVEARLALDLNPNDPEILADIGHYLTYMGAFERGTDLSRRAQSLNPLHPGWYYFSFARLHYHQRDYDQVISDVEKIGMPDFYWTHLLTAAALGQLGHPDAGAALARIFVVKPDFSAPEELRKWTAESGDAGHILEGLRKAGLRE